MIPLLLLTPFQHGYRDGITDGKGDARDARDSCGIYSSAADSQQCFNGYNLGFPKGCIGVTSKHDTDAEYMTCFDYFNLTQNQK